MIYLNKADFEKITLTNNIQENDTVLKLWDDGLLSNPQLRLSIMIYIDNSIAFCTYRNTINEDNYEYTDHYLVFGFHNEHKGFGQGENRILKVQKLNDKWFYVIERRYWYED